MALATTYDQWKTQGPPCDEEWEEDDMANPEERAETHYEPDPKHWEEIARSLAAALNEVCRRLEEKQTTLIELERECLANREPIPADLRDEVATLRRVLSWVEPVDVARAAYIVELKPK